MDRLRTIEHSKLLPAGMKWRTIGAARHADYLVTWDRGTYEPAGNAGAESLTEARKMARELVKDGRKWERVLRFAENGVSIRPVAIVDYEVAL